MPLLLAGSAFFASLYTYSNYNSKIKHSLLIKLATIISLVFVVIMAELPNPEILTNFRYLLILALCFHLVGDAVIELKDNLLYCIPWFMCGHLMYSYIFYQDIMLADIGSVYFTARHCLALGLAIAFGLYMAVTLLPRLSGPLLPGVVIYMLVLALVAILAIFHPSSQMGVPWLLIGVAMYIISDCLIAYNEFVRPIKTREVLVWPLYYFAQLFIVLNLLASH